MKRAFLESNPYQGYNWNIRLSEQAVQGSKRCGIETNLVLLAMDYSQIIFKEGLIFYVVVQRMIPINFDNHLREKLNKIIVVFSPEKNEVVKCYKALNGMHQIKRRSRRRAIFYN